MIVLVLFGTIEGHTAKIARRMANQIEEAGHQVVLSDVREPGFAVPGTFDAVVLCGPIHMGKFPQPLVQFINDFSGALNDVPSALVSVSLSAASENEDERKEAEACAYELCDSTGWVPTMLHEAAGAIKYVEYNYFKRFAMRRIMAHRGGPVDTHSDYEMTDWEALNHFTASFLAKATLSQ